MVPQKCPKCASRFLRQFGAGTEQVEDFVKKHFSKARVLRLDADTTSKKGAFRDILNRFRREEVNVLIGTQMIAKGLDFPQVTLVGVLSADMSLNFPDFRAGERTFQLLTQVSGRSGRGTKPGNVVIQCYDPGHFVLRTVQEHDFLSFFRREISFRRELGYPPFGLFLRFLATGPEQGTKDYTEELWKHISSFCGGDETISRPQPAPIRKIKGRFRWQILVRYPKGGFPDSPS